VSVFHRTGEIGVARARPGDRRPIDSGRISRRLRLHGHRALPVGPVLVRNQQRDGRARRHAAADTAQRLRAIRLDRHPAAAPVSALAPAQLARDGIEVDAKAGRKPLDDRDERLPV